MLQLTLAVNLRAVRLGKVVQELFGRAGQLQLLGATCVVLPHLNNLFLRGFLTLKVHKYGAQVTVGHRHANALRSKGRCIGRHDLVALNVTHQLQRLFLALFFLAADVRNHIVDHLRPALKGLACTADGLVGAHQHTLNAVLLVQGEDGGHIALQRTVGLYSDKAALGAQAFTLGGNNINMLGIQLRYHHGHIRSEPVGRVVRYHRALVLGILLLQRADLILFHIHGAEHKVYHRGDLFYICLGVIHRQVRHVGGNGFIHAPSAAQCLFVRFTSRACRGCQAHHFKPGVILQQQGEALTDHTGCADDTDFVLFVHCDSP